MILFVPGLGGNRQDYTILCEDLASHGYVVLSFDQPYVSNFVKFPNGTKLTWTLKDAWNVPRDRDHRYRYYDKAMAGSIADISYLLDHLDEIDAQVFGRILDQNQIVLMGHSFGGNVAHTLGFEDQRIKAIVDIDSKITERKIYGRVGVPPNVKQKPVLFIRGMMQYQEDVGDKFTKIANASFWSPSVQHSAFSDRAFLTRYINGFGHQSMTAKIWHWFWKIGPLFDAVDTGIGNYEINQWTQEYRSTIVSWLQNHTGNQFSGV